MRALLLSVCVLLAGCGTKTVTISRQVPAAYLSPCEATYIDADSKPTYGDLLDHLVDVQAERDACKAKHDLIRSFVQ